MTGIKPKMNQKSSVLAVFESKTRGDLNKHHKKKHIQKHEPMFVLSIEDEVT